MKSWDDFDKFEAVIDKYMPQVGEGSTMASQITTALNKLVYKWFNDGDIFDNTCYLEGWANDLSSYANWLNEHVNATELYGIEKCVNGSDYEDLLYSVCEIYLDEDYLARMDKKPKEGSIYDCAGDFRFDDHDDWDDADDDDWDFSEDDVEEDYL